MSAVGPVSGELRPTPSTSVEPTPPTGVHGHRARLRATLRAGASSPAPSSSCPAVT